MNTNSRIYLDNAATSWPKPASVYDAVDHYQREVGATGGRSGYREAVEADQIVRRARQGLARLIGAVDAKQVVFTASGTDSLNMAIAGVLQPGDHVVTTDCEHNSVLRPLRALSDAGTISVTHVPCDGQGFVDPAEVRQAFRPETQLVAVVHGSNVTGAIQPVSEISLISRDHGILMLLDAAQTLGEMPIDVERMPVDLLAAPTHKGLLGPLGAGVLYIRPSVEKRLRPLRIGGTGTHSELEIQPESLPEKYESGNQNLPALAGLVAAIEYLESRGIESFQSHHAILVSQLLDGLTTIPGLSLYGPTDTSNRTSVVSFTLSGYDPQELAALLETSGGVQCRAGLHCAPRMHRSLGTLEHGGTVRLSPGWATSADQIELTVGLIAQMAAVAP